MFLFFLGIVLLVAAVVFLFGAFEENSFTCFVICVMCGVGGVLLILNSGLDDPPKKQQVTVTVNGKSVTSDDNSAANTDENESQAADNSSDSSTDNSTGKFDPKNPEKWPGDKAPQEERQKWWDAWAGRQYDNASIICRDGIQYEVTGVVNGNFDTDSVAIWARLHPDGKPFSCSDPKNPTQEVSL